MTDTSKALELADELEMAAKFPAYPKANYAGAAAELRRLASVEAELAAIKALPVAWHEAVTKEADEWDMDRGSIESIFSSLLPSFMADKEAAGFVTLPLDSFIEGDDYGVDGSDFYRCKVCGAESGAGALNNGIKHDHDCPIYALPQTPKEST